MKLHSIKVSVYAGYRANERPLDFIFEGEKHKIKNIISQTYEEVIGGSFIRRYTVITGEGSRFKLRYDEKQDHWYLEE